MESLLTQLADELLVQDITEPSAVLGSLSDDELQAAYDAILEQFALELLIGADKNSEWSNGKLVIDANHGPIHLLQAAFYAVKLEVQRRKFMTNALQSGRSTCRITQSEPPSGVRKAPASMGHSSQGKDATVSLSSVNSTPSSSPTHTNDRASSRSSASQY